MLANFSSWIRTWSVDSGRNAKVLCSKISERLFGKGGLVEIDMFTKSDIKGQIICIMYNIRYAWKGGSVCE